VRAQIVVAVVLLAGAVVLVVGVRARRRRVAEAGTRPGPVRAAGVNDDTVVERAVDWVHARASVCHLERADVLTCVAAVHAYVRANAAPMNGGGVRSGYLVPPNMFDVVQALLRESRAAGLSVDDECAWEIVRLHDDFLRR